MLEGEFDVVEATARGLNLKNTFTFQAVVRELSGVFERVETEPYQALEEVVGGFSVLADLTDPSADDIGIVFGEDCFDTIVKGMTWKLRNGLKRTPTIFGWILHGGSGYTPAAGVAARANVHAFRASVHEQLQNFWALDYLGVAQEEVFERDLELEVKNAIKTLLKEGHMELLPNNCVPRNYLPHRRVVKLDRETTKLRIVHNASA